AAARDRHFQRLTARVNLDYSPYSFQNIRIVIVKQRFGSDFRERHRLHTVGIEKSSWSVAPTGLALVFCLPRASALGYPVPRLWRWCVVLQASSSPSESSE